MSGSSGGSQVSTPQAYTWTPAAPGRAEFTATPTAALTAGSSGGASQPKTGTAGNSYTGTVLGA